HLRVGAGRRLLRGRGGDATHRREFRDAGGDAEAGPFGGGFAGGLAVIALEDGGAPVARGAGQGLMERDPAQELFAEGGGRVEAGEDVERVAGIVEQVMRAVAEREGGAEDGSLSPPDRPCSTAGSARTLPGRGSGVASRRRPATPAAGSVSVRVAASPPPARLRAGRSARRPCVRRRPRARS